MKTFITILLLISIMITCYYINRFIVTKVNKNDYSWNEVKTNIIISIIIPLSVGYWIMYLLSLAPSFPEKPPRWL